MTSTAERLGDTPTGLATGYATATDPADRERCAAALVPVVRRVAHRVAAAGVPQDRADFVDDAPGLVLVPPGPGRAAPVAAFDPGRAQFTTWVYGVLRHRWADLRRLDRPNAPLPPDWPAPGSGQSCGLAPSLLTPFDPPDLAALSGWEPAGRLELLTLCGLWLKVPANLWDGWVREYETCRPGVALQRPFPPEGWDPAAPPKDRTAPLADLLGYRPNYLAVRLHRRGGRVRRLAFVRDLLG